MVIVSVCPGANEAMAQRTIRVAGTHAQLPTAGIVCRRHERRVVETPAGARWPLTTFSAVEGPALVTCTV